MGPLPADWLSVAGMEAKVKEKTGSSEPEEVGVLPSSGKGLNMWWLVFGALMLANFGTRLHK